MTLDYVGFSNFNQCATISNTTPGFVEQIASQGIKNDVDSFTIRSRHKFGSKTHGSGAEDTFGRNIESLNQEVPLLFGTNGCIDLRILGL